MTNSHYPHRGCVAWSQVYGEAEAGVAASAWNVNSNNGNVNNNHRNNNGFGLAARRVGEFQGVEESVPLQSLYNAWRRARRQKVPSHNQVRFDRYWMDGLLLLQKQITSGNWSPRRSTCFVATRPKAREIHAPDFADRVVHHWLIPQLEKIYEPRFIFDSYANRIGKGSHAAVRRAKAFVRQVHSGQGQGWFLKLDIANFFNSIHRETLWAALKPVLISAELPTEALHVVHALLRRNPLHAGVDLRASAEELAQVPAHKRLANADPGCGLTIGNLSSQFLANVYLDVLDQFVKHKLKAKRYLRYVDDFVLIHRDRDQLSDWLIQIERFLHTRLKLRLKDDTQLRPLTDGIDFLGYVIRPTHTLVRPRVVTHLQDTLRAWEIAHVDGYEMRGTPADFNRIRTVLTSYDGHMRHANAHRLMQRVHDRFPWTTSASKPRRFPNSLHGRPISIPFRSSCRG